MKHLSIGVLGAAALALAVGLVVRGDAKAVKGQFPPDFTGTTLDNKKVTLSDFRGKNPVVLSFFADFCQPCKREFPRLKEMDERLGSAGLRVIAVSLDEDRETASLIPKQNSVKFPVVFDPRGAIAEKYSVQAIPHTVIIDKEGKVHTVITGLDLEALEKAVQQVVR